MFVENSSHVKIFLKLAMKKGRDLQIFFLGGGHSIHSYAFIESFVFKGDSSVLLCTMHSYRARFSHH